MLNNFGFLVILLALTTYFSLFLFSRFSKKRNSINFTIFIYLLGIIIIMFGFTYAAVPLYQSYCRVYGLNNTWFNKKSIWFSNNIEFHKEFRDNKENQNIDEIKREINENNKENDIIKPLNIFLCAENSKDLPWNLKPCVPKITIFPGDTSLIFHIAHNLGSDIITGVATYSITPSRAGIYFNKIQCFCFEEQRLKGYESVELPILFYIDKDFINDPKIQDIDNITLSYTFYRLS